MVILLPEDFIHHENPEGHEERATEGASKGGAFFLRASWSYPFFQNLVAHLRFIGSRSLDNIFQRLCGGGSHICCTGVASGWGSQSSANVGADPYPARRRHPSGRRTPSQTDMQVLGKDLRGKSPPTRRSQE